MPRKGQRKKPPEAAGRRKNIDERPVKLVPRRRTAPKNVAEIKALDLGSEVSEHYVRQLAKDGKVPVVWAGKKALINLDDVLDLLRLGTSREEPTLCTVGGIRRIDMKRPI